MKQTDLRNLISATCLIKYRLKILFILKFQKIKFYLFKFQATKILEIFFLKKITNASWDRNFLKLFFRQKEEVLKKFLKILYHYFDSYFLSGSWRSKFQLASFFSYSKNYVCYKSWYPNKVVAFCLKLWYAWLISP